MNKALIVLVLAAGMLLASGCVTTNETADVRDLRLEQISDLQMRMLVEDWDYFWLFERNAGTTQWHPWVGI